jgi:two-component system response regulator AtoC
MKSACTIPHPSEVNSKILSSAVSAANNFKARIWQLGGTRVARTRILVVDDEPSALELLEMHLRERDFDVCSAPDAKGLAERIVFFRPEIVILDVRLPDADGLDLLPRVLESVGHPYVIVVTAFHDMATTIEAIKRGAFDYIPKPIDLDDLDAAIQRAVELSIARGSRDGLVIRGSDFEPMEIIGKTKEMKELFKTIGVLSNNRVTVLIEGETGTGKELAARAIHYHSSCKDQPFIAINCSAIVKHLLESELFGHEKGAFTGALLTKKGRFELAGHGTILLDEISEMPLELQPKLLRFLQDKELQRVGSEKTICSEARVIASTNRDLFQMVKNGSFREDLYYRLRVATVTIPPLRQRLADIPLIVEYLLKKINKHLDKRVERMEATALARLQQYNWPGNVRELENLLIRAVLHTHGNIILDETVEVLLKRSPGLKEAAREETASSEHPADGPKTEKEQILAALQSTKWHYGNACKILGISYPTLKKRLKEYGIRTKAYNQTTS